MQNKLESLIWDQKELQERFQMVVKEHKMMELLVTELEEEHDMAIAKIEKLQTKVKYFVFVCIPCTIFLYIYLTIKMI
ncbi:hypothetical protein TanjilG_27697 [Lupinus angustifolius]|uniref:Uncharacterized protein n=1 Tax=Lupinus angustifolius TaxID=3871 RepID=A0A4P1RHG8_LUPAN|nr:hypothetical protein TanjilG_27697 [Lupinus angustifolius]